jgi:hypothetical protein
LYHDAESVILQHPGRHLAVTPLFMMRGAAKAFPLLVIALIVAFVRRRDELLLFAVPAISMLLLYAFFTPFFFRYGSLPHLIATLCVLVMLKMAWDALLARQELRATAGVSG